MRLLPRPARPLPNNNTITHDEQDFHPVSSTNYLGLYGTLSTCDLERAVTHTVYVIGKQITLSTRTPCFSSDRFYAQYWKRVLVSAQCTFWKLENTTFWTIQIIDECDRVASPGRISEGCKRIAGGACFTLACHCFSRILSTTQLQRTLIICPNLDVTLFRCGAEHKVFEDTGECRLSHIFSGVFGCSNRNVLLWGWSFSDRVLNNAIRRPQYRTLQKRWESCLDNSWIPLLWPSAPSLLAN